ncbi:MAG: response regulator [Acidobacteriota bacterium]
MPSQSALASVGRALVVDDEAELREGLAEHLRNHGLEVATAGDGRAALLAVERRPSAFGPMSVDVELPVLGGFEVVKGAHATGSAAAVVIA